MKETAYHISLSRDRRKSDMCFSGAVAAHRVTEGKVRPALDAYPGA